MGEVAVANWADRVIVMKDGHVNDDREVAMCTAPAARMGEA